MMGNVNDVYFNGYYKEIWRKIIPDILTTRELDFIVNYFNLQPGSRVLDLMCGYGRHALGLARKGIGVTAIDNLKDYTLELAGISSEEGLPLEVIQADIVTAEINTDFDLAICMGNSLNFFNPGDTLKILQNTSRNLKPGGHLLVNTWSIEEIAIPSFKPRNEGYIDTIHFINESIILENPKRIEITSTMIDESGNREIKTAVDYVYSLEEMSRLFKAAGLELKEVYSIPGKKKFTAGEPRAYIIAVKK
jgi:SAM-dependent methyltransferase